jgi:hypothetical protein
MVFKCLHPRLRGDDLIRGDAIINGDTPIERNDIEKEAGNFNSPLPIF